MILHIIKWFLQSTGVFIVGIPVTLLGLIVVPLAIPFSRVVGEMRPFTDPRYSYRGYWFLERLPVWALPWDNVYDGLLGDKRGWWANDCEENGYSFHSFKAKFLWASIRNPANYWSRIVTGCDVRTVELLAGQPVCDEDNPGWHFLRATDAKGRSFYYLGFVFPWWFDKTHAVYGRFGWKLKLEHNGMRPDAPEQDRIRASVYRVSPWKAIS
jgi:hypothetical protein